MSRDHGPPSGSALGLRARARPTPWDYWAWRFGSTLVHCPPTGAPAGNRPAAGPQSRGHPCPCACTPPPRPSQPWTPETPALLPAHPAPRFPGSPRSRPGPWPPARPRTPSLCQRLASAGGRAALQIPRSGGLTLSSQQHPGSGRGIGQLLWEGSRRGTAPWPATGCYMRLSPCLLKPRHWFCSSVSLVHTAVCSQPAGSRSASRISVPRGRPSPRATKPTAPASCKLLCTDVPALPRRRGPRYPRPHEARSLKQKPEPHSEHSTHARPLLITHTRAHAHTLITCGHTHTCTQTR